MNNPLSSRARPGIHFLTFVCADRKWIPAFAGMTVRTGMTGPTGMMEPAGMTGL